MDRSLTLTLTDDGVGFDPDPDVIPATERLFCGNGLANMRKRMAEIAGYLEIITAPGRGTTLVFTLNLA